MQFSTLAFARAGGGGSLSGGGGGSYSKEVLNRNIEEIYFNLQEAWTSMDYSQVEEYMSSDLYKNHKAKLGWMVVRKRQNILQKIRLLAVKHVGVQHYLDSSKDVVWFYIKGLMIDYIINSEPMK